MTTFRFGSLAIEASAYGSQGGAVLGIRDSGKTYTATLLAERLFAAGIPFTAFDPIGVWRFLRVPGKGAGIPVVVAGGTEGDLALTPNTAPAIVEAAMQNGISLVIDLFSLELSKADWRRIVRDSVRLMLHKNSRHGLRHVFIEEAAEFAPQRVIDGDVYAEIEKLARMGGNSRLGYTLINQRAEEVNKAVLELCDNLFLHRQKGRNSLVALSKWLDIGNVKDHKAIIETLATLPTGECWAWLAGTDRPVHVHVPPKNSLHPDRRVMRGDDEVKTLGAVDVGAFVESMRESLGRVEEEMQANDPKLLRKRIADLEREAKRQQPAADPAAVEDEIRTRLDAAAEEIKGKMRLIADSLTAAIDNLESATEIISSIVEPSVPWDGKPLLPAAAPAKEPTKYNPNSQSVPAARKPAPRKANGLAGELHAAARAMLAELAAIAPAMVTWSTAATLAGLKARGGHFNAGRKDLVDRGLIVIQGDLIGANASAVAMFGPNRPQPKSPAEILEMWCSKLPAPAPEMLAELARQAAGLSREQLAARLGKKPIGGHWNSGMKLLRDNGLIVAEGERWRIAPLMRTG